MKNQFQVLITIYYEKFRGLEGNHELQRFSELYGVTIEIYDRITSTRARHIISCLVNSETIRLFFTGNHYDSLLPKNQYEQSVGVLKNSNKKKSSEFKKKNESHIINRKDDDKFANEESNDCSEEYFKSIKKYLLDAKYLNKIINIKVTKKRNEAKSKFRKLVIR